MSVPKIRSWFFVLRYTPLKVFMVLRRFARKRKHNPTESLELEWDHNYNPGVAWRMAISLSLILRQCSSERLDWFINYLDSEETGSLSSEEVVKIDEVVAGAAALNKVESEVVSIFVESGSKDVSVEIGLNTRTSSWIYLRCGQE